MTATEQVTRDLMRRAVFNLRYVELANRPDDQMRLYNEMDPDLNRVIEDEWIRRAFGLDGPTFEFTQLLNSFLLAFVHPWENHFRKKLRKWKLVDASYAWSMPQIYRTRDGQVVDDPTVEGLVRFFRNAMAHENFKLISDSGNRITSVEFWNIPYFDQGEPEPPRSDWRFATVTVQQMRDLLFAFVHMTEELMKENGDEFARARAKQARLADSEQVTA